MLRHSDLVTLRGAPPAACSHCGGRPVDAELPGPGKTQASLKRFDEASDRFTPILRYGDRIHLNFRRWRMR